MRLVLATTTLLVLAFGIAARLDPLSQGLTATYFADVNWTSVPLKSLVEPEPSIDTQLASWQGHLPETYSATWTGSLVVLRDGLYTFATASDDGSWLFIDGHPVVDNGGRHARRVATGVIQLERGVHSIFLKYVQEGGPSALELFWGPTATVLTPVPAWALWTRHAEFRRILASMVVWRGFRITLLIWVVSLTAAAAFGVATRLPAWIAYWTADPVRRALTIVVLGSVVLNLIGITWGLPSEWVGDEFTPTAVMMGIAHRYTNGWFDRYPPLHFYVLTLAYAPWLVLKASGWLHVAPPTEDVVLFLIGRLVGVAFGAATLVAVYACGAQSFGRGAGVWAAALFGLLTPLVFYAKTANPEVPYVFWFALSLAFYLRALQTLQARDLALMCIAAAAAIGTKDQAYALYLSVPFVLAYQIRRAGRRVADWRLWMGPVLGLAVFAAIHNLAFNLEGFINHVRDITGPGRAYRMFEPTFSGQLALLRLSVDIDRRSWGWPFFVLTLAGVFFAVRNRSHRLFAGALLLVAASYYAGFIAVILYNYDRYLLPICVVQALFGGVAIEWLLARHGRPIVLAAFAYTLLYAATVDVLMWRDSRYAAEGWLTSRAMRGHDRLVATIFPLVTEPRMQAFESVDIGTIDNLHRWNPDYFVVNADYARAVPADARTAPLVNRLRSEALGYRRAFNYRAQSPWPWLPAPHPDLVGPRDDAPIVSFLRDINPSIEIYERVDP